MEFYIKDMMVSIEGIDDSKSHELKSEIKSELKANPKARVNDLIHSIIHKKYNAKIKVVDVIET